jgi:hypothetical protein
VQGLGPAIRPVFTNEDAMTKRINPIKSSLEYMSNARKELTLRRNVLLRNAKFLKPFIKATQHCDDPFLSATSYGSMDISARLDDLDGFKDEKLISVLSALDDLGPRRVSTEDYPESLNRDFHFNYDIPGGGTLRVSVPAYVRSDSPTCRKVLVSSKPVVTEEKVYEIKCD